MIYKFKREFIETEVGKIIYYIRGDGPPVLLLHGYPQYSLMWEETALLLSDKYTTIIPDLRGYGESAKPKGLFDHSANRPHNIKVESTFLCSFLITKIGLPGLINDCFA